jgi:hypothetical protein
LKVESPASLTIGGAIEGPRRWTFHRNLPTISRFAAAKDGKRIMKTGLKAVDGCRLKIEG